jgi:phosphoserine phosphatase RsbU/P
MPPLIRRRDGIYERLGSTGVALGMFEGSAFGAVETTLGPGETLVLYSDGITEAENPAGEPFEESGLEMVLERHAAAQPADIGTRILAAVAEHARDSRFTDDLTILIFKRAAPTASTASVIEAIYAHNAEHR